VEGWSLVYLLSLINTIVTETGQTGDQALYLPTLSGGLRRPLLVLLLLSADVLLLGGDSVGVHPHEVRHVPQDVDLILNVHVGLLLLSSPWFVVTVFWYDLKRGPGHLGPFSGPAALVLGDAKLGKLADGSSSTALQLVHLMEERGGVLHE